ncbi:MAG: hypothetical protein ABIG96_01770 [Candidatus Micrarchaeota archaeon]
MNKGLFSGDFVVGLAIFLVILLIVSPMWSSVTTQVENSEAERRLQIAGIEVSETLLRTKGFPEDWNSTSVISIGLAGETRVLNATKAKYFFQFMESNYTDAKFMLGAGAYDMRVEIANNTGLPVIFEGVEFTRDPVPANSYDVTNTERLAVLEFNESYAEFVSLQVSVWRS